MSHVSHKRIKFDYEILETIQCGIELFGHEVKAVKLGHGKLEGAYASIDNGELFLKGAHISQFQSANTPASYNPDRVRKLLVKRSEIAELSKKLSTKGLTLVPVSLYNKGNKIKVDLALVRGKKKYDKRESIKKRDIERDLGRTLKTRS